MCNQNNQQAKGTLKMKHLIALSILPILFSMALIFLIVYLILNYYNSFVIRALLILLVACIMIFLTLINYIRKKTN